MTRIEAQAGLRFSGACCGTGTAAGYTEQHAVHCARVAVSHDLGSWDLTDTQALMNGMPTLNASNSSFRVMPNTEGNLMTPRQSPNILTGSTWAS